MVMPLVVVPRATVAAVADSATVVIAGASVVKAAEVSVVTTAASDVRTKAAGVEAPVARAGSGANSGPTVLVAMAGVTIRRIVIVPGISR
jgi:hypothetical protein